MLEFEHALTGATIAYLIPHPAVALPLAFASHFVVDLLPHWNPNLGMKRKKQGLFYLPTKTIFFIVIDCLVGLFLGLWLASRVLPNLNRAVLVVLGAFFAVLPDLAEAPYLFLGIKNRWTKKLFVFQKSHQFKASFWPGMLFQAILALVLLRLVLL